MLSVPYHRFMDFIAPAADRFGVLTALLTELKLRFSTLDISGNRHVLVSPGEGQTEEPPPALSEAAVVLVAHYDRTADSPGANDNGAAVFQLIESALRLREEGAGTWRIIFTDKEELSRGEGIRDQGSYTLARTLRETGLRKSRFYIFDACGAGNTLIISTMADHLMRDETGPGAAKTRQRIQWLRDHALETARNLHLDRVLLTPTPFSDDAGFLRAGIAAQTITMLPAPEAAQAASLMRNKPDLIDALVNRDARNTWNPLLIPETWRTLNGPRDTFRRLTPENFKWAVRFACALCGA
jgi:hypothetical protein